MLCAALLNQSLAGNAADILAAANATLQETVVASLTRATTLLQTVTDAVIADATTRLSTLVSGLPLMWHYSHRNMQDILLTRLCQGHEVVALLTLTSQ